jgi:hypothetical protein
LCVLVLAAEGAQGRFLSRQQARTAPRGRIACLPSSTVGTRYPDPFALGHHSYGFSLSERNGIVYTCRGGHIDITHVRKLTDWTAYLAYVTREALLENRGRFTYRMREPSIYYVRIEYPRGWRDLCANEKQTIAREVSIELAQYLAYNGSIWHEILTWFGFKGIGIWPEYLSAFSWEDNYSNVLGCRIGAAALRDSERDFSSAVTLLLDRELRALGVQPRPMAYRAGQAVRDWWFVGDLWSCDITKRHFDVGLDDGIVTPWLVPGLAECDGATAQEYPAPTLTTVEKYGFSVLLEIEPKEWEKAEIFRIVRHKDRKAKRIEPARHFGSIVESIRARAAERYGPFVDDCRTPPGWESHPDVPETADFEDLTTLAARWLSEDMS